jgi:hypothetical protein
MTREELYQLVWSKPMIHAAAEFAVSGSYLARVCALLCVPRPERGYWARLAVGHAMPLVPLPAAKLGHPLEWSKETGFGPSAGQPPSVPHHTFKQFKRLATKVAVSATHRLIAGARKDFENSRPVDFFWVKYGDSIVSARARWLPARVATVSRCRQLKTASSFPGPSGDSATAVESGV